MGQRKPNKAVLGLSYRDNPNEFTSLPTEDEIKYKKWLSRYAPADIDPKTEEPYDDVKYDYRGMWKDSMSPFSPNDKIAGYGPPQFEGAHGTDTYKQHGHPTFSTESKYSRGPQDAGQWLPGTDVLMRPQKMHESINNLTPEDEAEMIYGPILGKAAWKAAHIINANLNPRDAAIRQINRAKSLVNKFKDSALDKFYR